MFSDVFEDRADTSYFWEVLNKATLDLKTSLDYLLRESSQEDQSWMITERYILRYRALPAPTPRNILVHEKAKKEQEPYGSYWLVHGKVSREDRSRSD